METSDIRAMVDSVCWYHSFEVAPGVMTPGRVMATDLRDWMDRAGVPTDLQGVRALDIGSWDGPYAFELEDRGADVVAFDIHDPNETGFNAAKKIRGSKVEYVRGSVYELADHVSGPFDLVMFKGVFYHLRYPMMALDKIYEVVAPKGKLFFEGECLINYVESVDERPPDLDPVAIGTSNIPLVAYFGGRYKGADNFYVPNFQALKSWLWSAGFEVVRHDSWEDPEGTPYPGQRIWGIAQRRDDHVYWEHEMH